MSDKQTAILALMVDGVVGAQYALDKPELTIGRRAGNDVRIEDVAVSGHHARIQVVPNAYLDGAEDIFVEDLGSTNGTRVNGEPVKRRRLNHRDEIQIGWNTFTLLDERQAGFERTAFIVQD